MSATLDDVLASASRLAGDRLVVVAASGHVLTLRHDDETKIHDLPRLDQIDIEAEFESQFSQRGPVRLGPAIPWTANTWRVDAECEFRVPGVPNNRCLWTPAVIPLHDAPKLFSEDAITAIRHDDGMRSGVAAIVAKQSGANKMSTTTDRTRMIAHQVKAEPVYQAFGDSAAAPLAGESERDYAARLATPFLKYSKRWKDANLKGVGDAAVVSTIADEVYQDAMLEAKRPTAASLRPGELRAVKRHDASGRPITEYVAADESVLGSVQSTHSPCAPHLDTRHCEGGVIALLKMRGPSPQRADRQPLKAAVAKLDAAKLLVAEKRATVERLAAVIAHANDAVRTAEHAQREAKEFQRTWAQNGCQFSDGRRLQDLEDKATIAAKAADRASRRADAVRPELALAESALESAQVDARAAEDRITSAISVIIAHEATPLLKELEEVAEKYRGLFERAMGVSYALARPSHLWNRMNPSAEGERLVDDAIHRASIQPWNKVVDAAQAHDFMSRKRGDALPSDADYIDRLRGPWLARGAELRRDPDA